MSVWTALWWHLVVLVDGKWIFNLNICLCWRPGDSRQHFASKLIRVNWILLVICCFIQPNLLRGLCLLNAVRLSSVLTAKFADNLLTGSTPFPRKAHDVSLKTQNIHCIWHIILAQSRCILVLNTAISGKLNYPTVLSYLSLSRPELCGSPIRAPDTNQSTIIIIVVPF